MGAYAQHQQRGPILKPTFIMTALTETAVQFAKGGRLFGILTVPHGADRNLPMVVIPNTGLEHRVGPNRLHVHLARALAARGYCTFRFDVSGLGDSDPEPGQRADSRVDFFEALNALQARGFGPRFNLLGVCSGAHDCMQFAPQDDRVNGVFAIDGYAYRNSQFHWQLFLARLKDPTRTARKCWEAVSGLWSSQADVPAGAATSIEPWPTQAEAGKIYESLLARGVHIAMVFTGDVQGDYFYAAQQYDVFPFLKGHAQVWHLPEMDHTLTRLESRHKLIHLACDWLIGNTD